MENNLNIGATYLLLNTTSYCKNHSKAWHATEKQTNKQTNKKNTHMSGYASSG